MVRDDAERTLLFDLDCAIQRVATEIPNSPTPVQPTAVYHNLLRRWAVFDINRSVRFQPDLKSA